MPDTPSVTINKRFTYRNQQEVWSNKYHFSGTTPTNEAGWKTLADAIWAQEKTFLIQDVKYVGFLGHEAGNEFAVANQDFAAAGLTLDTGVYPSDGDNLPGDAAVWVRWSTPDRSSRGKRIYCRKYFHGINANGDALANSVRTSMVAYGAKMIDGSLPGGFKLCGPQGAVASAPVVAPFVSFRQLKRTGKRPSS